MRPLRVLQPVFRQRAPAILEAVVGPTAKASLVLVALRAPEHSAESLRMVRKDGGSPPDSAPSFGEPILSDKCDRLRVASAKYLEAG